MARVGYYGRDGMPMTREQWTQRQSDPTYVKVREYDNGVVRLTLKWTGRVQDPTNTFPEYYPLFVLLVQNYKSDGTLANDPAEGDKTFGDEAAAIAAYEKFLLQWTECSTDDNGEFIEEDNILTPPPPPDPNRPASEPEGLDGGAW